MTDVHSREWPGFLIVVAPGLQAVDVYASRRVCQSLQMLWKENGRSNLGEQYPRCNLVRRHTNGA
jgi:hypothetical protein